LFSGRVCIDFFLFRRRDELPEEKKRPKVEDFDVKRMSRIYFGRRILRIIWINSTSKEFIATIGGIS